MQMVPNYDVLWSSANHLKVNLTPNIHSLVSILYFKSTLRQPVVAFNLHTIIKKI